MNMTLDILQCLADPKEMMAEGHVGTIRSAAGSKPSGEGIGAAHSCVPSVSYHRFLLQMLLCPALYCPDLHVGNSCTDRIHITTPAGFLLSDRGQLCSQARQVGCARE